jgi:hypothetical protein
VILSTNFCEMSPRLNSADFTILQMSQVGIDSFQLIYRSADSRVPVLLEALNGGLNCRDGNIRAEKFSER